jgi:hypothetical protein
MAMFRINEFSVTAVPAQPAVMGLKPPSSHSCTNVQASNPGLASRTSECCDNDFQSGRLVWSERPKWPRLKTFNVTRLLIQHALRTDIV